MSKFLCVNKSDLFKTNIDAKVADIYVQDPSSIFRLKPQLKDTEQIDETVLKILPYMTLFNRQSKEVFIYQRNQSDQIGDKANQCSIGVGEYVQMPELKDYVVAQTLAQAMQRQLLDYTGVSMSEAMAARVYENLQTGNCGVLYCNRQVQDRSRVAVSMFLGLTQEQIDEFIPLLHNRGQWMTMDHIIAAIRQEHMDVETYSLMVLDMYYRVCH